VKDIDALFTDQELITEVATDVEILYSDSSYVRVKIKAPKMIRHVENKENIEEFPEGVNVTFYNEAGRAQSWLEANYAIRRENEGNVYVKDDVLVYNKQDDKMKTLELIWDEKEKILKTDKPVLIMQPSLGDTLFGFGVVANEDFSRFEIKKKMSAIKKFDGLLDEETSGNSRSSTPEKPNL
jgi:LPS export ABC transporter protein LptC